MAGELDAKQLYLQAIRETESALPGRGLPWMRELRTHAAERFGVTGFPTTRDEAWKYTNLAPLIKQRFQIAPANGAAPGDGYFPTDLDVYRLVFVNGRYRSDLSNVPNVANRPVAGSLKEGLERHPDIFEQHLGRVAPAEMHALTALNTSLLLDGAYVFLPSGATIDRPIHLVYASTADAFTQPRTLVVANAGSRATVIEQYVGAPDARYFTNAVTEVVLERGASLEHYRLQQESLQGFHVNGLYLRQREKSVFVSHGVDLGGLLVRNDLGATLSAEGASCAMNGLYIVDGRQHVDNHTVVDHAKPRCISKEFYKGVLGGRGRAVFNGRVLVRPEAQQTDAEQVNNNLLLSDDAEIDTKPELEIYADDVKCSHGATIGQLDEDQLFYLRARGVDNAAARDLLTFAFANDVLHRFRLAPLRLMLERSLTARLLQGRDLRELELI